MLAGAGVKGPRELFDTIDVGWTRVGVEAHVAHVPHECRFKRVDLGDGLAELADGDWAPSDMDVGDEGDVEVRNVLCVRLADSACVGGCAKACQCRE